MYDDGCTRRTVMKAVTGAFTCVTCAGTGAAAANTSGAQDDSTSDSDTDNNDPSTDINWNVLDIDGEPMSIRYTDGNRDDAEMIRDMAIQAREHTLDVWDHELHDDITFDLYPGEHYEEDHDGMAYDGIAREARMVTPSDYNGSRDPTNEELMHTYYLHGVIHEYVHAPQVDATHHGGNGLEYPLWFWEGFVEGITVYHTDDDVRDQYHNRRDAVEKQQTVANGYGYLLEINEDPYRGSMQVFRYLFDEYSIEHVAGVYEQTAGHYLQALELHLGITVPELELGWLEYASNEFGGDYSHVHESLNNRSATSSGQEQDTSVRDDQEDTPVITNDQSQYNTIGAIAGGAAAGGVVSGLTLGGVAAHQYGKASASNDPEQDSESDTDDSDRTENTSN